MSRLAFETTTGSVYLVRHTLEGRLQVVRVSDHPVAGDPEPSTSFVREFDRIVMEPATHGIRLRFIDFSDPNADFITDVVARTGEMTLA